MLKTKVNSSSKDITERNYPTRSTNKIKNKFEIKDINRVTIIIIGAVVLVLASISIYLFINWRDAKKELDSYSDPAQYEKLQKERAQITVDAVKKLMILPDDEPTIATIIDIDSLKKQNQEFYKNAKNEDKILLYVNKAIIYRESSNIIVNVLPVVSVPQNADGTSTKPLLIEIKNGTDSSDAYDSVQASVQSISSAKVVDAGEYDDSDTTIVYDLSNGASSSEIQKLASDLGYQYSDSVPDNIESNASVVIVLGDDKF